MKLFVALPATRLEKICEESVDALRAYVKEEGWQLTVDQESASGVVFARNRLASTFCKGDWDAFLTVDGDAGFDAADVIEWAASGLDIVAVPRPCKSIDWGRVHAAALRGVPAHRLQRIASDLVFNQLEDGSAPAKQSGTGATFVEVSEVATHTLLARRAVFKRIMDAAGQALRYGNGERDGSWGFFQEMVIEGKLLSDDFFFCRLARSTGSRVYIHAEALSRHAGTHVYEGCLADHVGTPAQ